MPGKHLKVPNPGWPRFAKALLGRRWWEDYPEGVPPGWPACLGGRVLKLTSHSRDFTAPRILGSDFPSGCWTTQRMVLDVPWAVPTRQRGRS